MDSFTIKATLTDFGLSRVMSGSAVISTKTMLAGMPGYQAPEQLRAESVGVHSDVYAFGCVLLCTKSRCFGQACHSTKYYAKLLWPTRNLIMSNLSGNILNLAQKCLFSCGERPLSKDVLEDLLSQRFQFIT